MSGLLSGVLPAVFSAGNKLKRQIGGLLSDPVGTVQQQVGLLNDKAGAFNQLMAQAAQEHVNSLKTGGGMGQAQMKLANTLADSYNPAGMVVWHGSPHKFGKFDSSKIGTGEGAQAYGHGLYLAESPEVAQSYRAAVSAEKGRSFGLDDGPTKGIATLIAARGDEGEALARKAYASLGDQLEPTIAAARQAVDNGSSLYKVDLPDDAIAKMLDWDKPLSQQAPEVQSVLSKVARMDATGEQAWKAAVRESGNPFSPIVEQRGALFDTPEAAAKNLQRLGIPGIRYLDGGSRGAGSGTSNFVVFPGNEGLLTILERNGQPLK